MSMALDTLVRSVLRPRQPSRRTGVATPSNWFVDWIRGGETTASGIPINVDTALTYAAVWRAVMLISTACAKTPLHIYKRVQLPAGEGKERATEHPAYSLLRRQPNPEMTSFVFRQTLIGHALLQGSGFAHIERDRADNPIALWPLLPTETGLERRNSVLRYWTMVDGRRMYIAPVDVFHVKGLSPNGLQPYSVFDKAKESLGLGLAARKYGAKFFKNDATPSCALEHPARLDDQDIARLRDSWREVYGGDNQRGVAVLEEGMKFHQFEISNEDAQFLETRQFEIREIANWFGLPPHKLGDTTRTAYNSLEQENQAYLDDTLDGWFCNWEEECRAKLLSEQEQATDSHIVEFLRQSLVRANLRERYEAYNLAINARILNPNEARALENLDPYKGGDEFLVPLNVGGQAGTEEPAEPDEDDEPEANAAPTRAAIRGVLIESCQRAIALLANVTRRAAKEPAKFNDAMDELVKHRAALMANLGASLRLIGADSREVEETVSGILTQWKDDMLAIAGECKAADLADRIVARLAFYETCGAEEMVAPIMERKAANGHRQAA